MSQAKNENHGDGTLHPNNVEGGKPVPNHETAAEQAREAKESAEARNASASNRERMIDIGRGQQQAGRHTE